MEHHRPIWKGPKSVRCDLTKDERIARTERVRDLDREIEEKKADFATEKKAMESSKKTLLDTAANGYEFRDVECASYANDEQCEVYTIRLDTGEVIHRRTMTMDERQHELGLS